MRRLAVAAVAAAVLAPAGAAGVHVRGVDTTAYPTVRASVVTSSPAARPRVWENGMPVVGLETENLGRSKSLVLAVDRSRSMAGASIANATSAAASFVAAKPAADRIALVAFGRQALAMTRFSSSTIDVDSALRSVSVDQRSGTALYDAVVVAAHELAAEPQPGRVILLLTDGHDVSSASTIDDAIAAAHAAGAAVYPIAIRSSDFAAAPLERLARETGGTYYEAGSSSVLDRIYGSIARELARTWRVQYVTSARPGDKPKLDVSVPGEGRAEASYSVPPALGVPPAPTAPSGVLPRGAWGSTAGALGLALAVALLILLAARFVFAGSEGARLRARIEPHLGEPTKGRKLRRSGERFGAAKAVFRATEAALGHLRQWRALQRLLERADLPLRTAEFAYIALGSGFVLALVFAIAGSSPILILLALAGGAALPVLFVWHKAGRRLKMFENQLPDLLITLAASLKAGHSFRHGIATVVEEGQPPASKEFKRVLTETQLGRSMDEALSDMSERVGSSNLEFVITAVTIQRQVGGSLAGLFDMVADAVRQRQQFARKIRGLTAMGRMSAYTLIGLPFFIAIAITLLNPAYMAPLYGTSTGHKLIVVGLMMIAFGTAILKKIVSFKG